MKNKFKLYICFILAISMLILSAIPSFASNNSVDNKGQLVDSTGTITSESAVKINRLIDEAYEKYGCSVIVYYTNYVNSDDDIRDKDAENIYLRGNYCESGVLLYLGIKSRSFDIYVRHGDSEGKISYDEGDWLNNAIMPLLRANDFDGAAVKFTELALEFASNDVSDRFISGKSIRSCVTSIVISLIVAGIISTVTVLSMRSKMNTVKFQKGASRYCDSGETSLTESKDRFLYSTVTKTPKPQSTSSGGGHSGGHSGGGSHHGGHF